jgi:hypothetical protein
MEEKKKMPEDWRITWITPICKKVNESNAKITEGLHCLATVSKFVRYS